MILESCHSAQLFNSDEQEESIKAEKDGPMCLPSRWKELDFNGPPLVKRDDFFSPVLALRKRTTNDPLVKQNSL